jgi:YD repeat-containing protein
VASIDRIEPLNEGWRGEERCEFDVATSQLSCTSRVEGEGTSRVETRVVRTEYRSVADRTITTFTSWDGAGRPLVGSRPGEATLTFAYDDRARRTTQTSTSLLTGGVSACETYYDVDGNRLGYRCTDPAYTVPDQLASTVVSSERVCK